MEDIPHHRVQILHPSGEQLRQEKVQQPPVLQHAVAQPGGQGRVPAIQMVPLDIVLQHAVGPGRPLPAGDQRVQRGFSGSHTYPSNGWPRK